MHTLRVLVFSMIALFVSACSLQAAPELYFTADNLDGAGREICKYDGSGSPTRVTNINTAGSSFLTSTQQLTAYRGKLYFSATDGVNGYELWSINAAGTPTLVYDAYGNSSPSNMAVYNDSLYFRANNFPTGDVLYKYTGTGSPTVVSGVPQVAAHLTVFKDKLYLQAGSWTETGGELYVINGDSPAALVADLKPGASMTSNPSSFRVTTDNLYFNAESNDDSKNELWTYNETDGPVKRVDNVGVPAIFNNTVYMKSEIDGVSGLYSYNGMGGLSLVSDDIQPLMENAAVLNNTLYFTARDWDPEMSESQYGYELWSLDSNNNLARLTDIMPGADDAMPSELLAYDGKLYFTTYTSRLYSYDPINGATAISDMIEPKSLNLFDPVAGDNGTIYSFLKKAVTDLGLFTINDIDTLSALFRDGENLLSPGAETIGDITWSYIGDATLPGQPVGAVLGDNWEYGGKYYIYLGSGLEGSGPLGGGADVPEPSTLLLLLPFIGFGLKKLRGKKA